MNKIALITGASRGIGAALARVFAQNGYHLALCCHKSDAQLDALANELSEQYHIEICTFTGDVGDYSFVEQMVNKTLEKFSKIDVLVNNAGISYIGLLTDMQIEDWNHIVATNLTSVFSTCRCCVPSMVSQKAERSSAFLLSGEMSVPPVRSLTQPAKAESILLPAHLARNLLRATFRSMPSPAVSSIPI